MAVLEGFEGIYRSNVVLILLKTIYSLNNTEKEFWRELSRAFAVMVCSIINVDPYMYSKWSAM